MSECCDATKMRKCTLVAILGLKCSKLHSNPIDLVSECCDATRMRKCTLVAILGLKCSKLHSNPVDLVCQNAVMPLK